jgi:FAD dependent oxidoreductase
LNAIVAFVYDRVVIGGGVFGAYSAIVLAKLGLKVLIVEKNLDLMQRASLINQARIHTGLHYPRSLLTARESLNYYEKFRKSFPDAVQDFSQIYAISRFNSKTSAEGFENFIKRLGIKYEQINPSSYFNRGSISAAFRVEEPTFAADTLKNVIMEQISSLQNIDIYFGRTVLSGEVLGDTVTLNLDDLSRVSTKGVVIATYASINALRMSLGLDVLPLKFEIAEVLLGEVDTRLKGIGFTVMDGPFWSMMPFGKTNYTSLTSVGFTPLDKSVGLPIFSCQQLNEKCSPSNLQDCDSCKAKPASNNECHLRQMRIHLKSDYKFSTIRSMTTIKTILSTTEVDDARPTIIHREKNANIITIFSGKISTIFDLEDQLQ